MELFFIFLSSTRQNFMFNLRGLKKREIRIITDQKSGPRPGGNAPRLTIDLTGARTVVYNFHHGEEKENADKS